MQEQDTINAKEIRQDLQGFLKRLKSGKPLTIIYRSKPYVTVSSSGSSDLKSPQPGSKRAINRSLVTARLLRESQKNITVSDSYHDLLEQKYGRI